MKRSALQMVGKRGGKVVCAGSEENPLLFSFTTLVGEKGGSCAWTESQRIVAWRTGRKRGKGVYALSMV